MGNRFFYGMGCRYRENESSSFPRSWGIKSKRALGKRQLFLFASYLFYTFYQPLLLVRNHNGLTQVVVFEDALRVLAILMTVMVFPSTEIFIQSIVVLQQKRLVAHPNSLSTDIYENRVVRFK